MKIKKWQLISRNIHVWICVRTTHYIHLVSRLKMCKYTHDTCKSYFVEHELNMTTLTKFVCTTDVKYLSHTQGLTKGLSDMVHVLGQKL
jgi:hypothetical protein